MALNLYPSYWRQIAGPFVVPMAYSSERGSTSILSADWDGDTEDLPNCIWVADKGAIENIRALECVDPSRGVYAVAISYAESVGKEYASWCEADCYGCVTEVFKRVGTNDDFNWEQESEEAVWGCIGYGHALDSLKTEYFDAVITQLKSALPGV